MIATVKEVKFNQPLGSYKVTKLSVTTDKGEDKDYNIFTNAKYHNIVAQLRAGDSIEIKMEKNGKYWNVSDVTKLEGSGGSGSPGSTVRTANSGGTGGTFQSGQRVDNSVAIARAVALKAAVESAVALLESGGIKKTIKPAAYVEEVFAICKRFEGYCTLAEDIEALTTDSRAIEKGSGERGGDEFEEAPFPN